MELTIEEARLIAEKQIKNTEAVKGFKYGPSYVFTMRDKESLDESNYNTYWLEVKPNGECRIFSYFQELVGNSRKLRRAESKAIHFSSTGDNH